MVQVIISGQSVIELQCWLNKASHHTLKYPRPRLRNMVRVHQQKEAGSRVSTDTDQGVFSDMFDCLWYSPHYKLNATLTHQALCLQNSEDVLLQQPGPWPLPVLPDRGAEVHSLCRVCMYRPVERLFRVVEGMYRAVEGMQWTVEGMFRAVEGMYRAVEVMYRAVEGMYRAVEGMYRAVEGMYRAVEVMYRAVEGMYRAVEGMYKAVESPLILRTTPCTCEMLATNINMVSVHL
uniref:Uncharacterized protein n=1 Tax=Timema monikensis TaxID=170555 RepID=A0A7R9E749_9NEOP|nr:unnamed protein product [Timema monikensis]